MKAQEETKNKRPRLKRFTVQNFKAFRDFTVSLAPLTILIGENSSGKSSILQALLLLKQTLEAPHGSGVLVLNSHYVQFGKFKEIVFGVPVDQGILTFDLEFEDFKLSFKIGYKTEDDRPRLLEFKVNNLPLTLDRVFDFAPPVDDNGQRYLISDYLLPDSFFRDFPEQYKAVRSFFENIGYVQPIRPAPERYYNLSGIKPRWIGVRAENIADFLEANPEVEEEVRDWFVESVKLAKDVKFDVDQHRGLQILFIEPTTGLEVDISRLGFGYSQMLPIVVASFSDMNTLIFEAPEIHLNPNLHGALTDLFINAANRDKQVLVETHSEHVIYRIQRRIAEGKIAPDDVALYYIRRGQQGSVAERLTITEKGEIPDWPDGFFETEMEDIFERVLAGSKD